MTKYQQHVARWKDCRLCGLCENRQHVVLMRGRIPCDVLFTGEAPGESEDAIGKPFIGPAGKLLDRIIRQAFTAVPRALESTGPEEYTCGFTNLICCIPRDADGTDKLAQPPEESIKACSPRLKEFIAICKPRLIVCVGALATKWVPKTLAGTGYAEPALKLLSIVHPAAILRANIAQQGLMIQRCEVQLANALEELNDR